MMKRVVLIDGNHLARRSWHKLSKFKTSKGIPSGALFGFIKSFRKLVLLLSPNKVVVVFDGGSNSKRAIDVNYKSNRPPPEESFINQLSDLKDLLKALTVATISVEGEEADDIIGGLTGYFRKPGQEVVVVSSDSDFNQLVRSRIWIYDDLKGIFLDSEAVEQEYKSLPPLVVADVKAIAGDKTDNVPGVPGVGIARALDLLLVLQQVAEKLGYDPDEFPLSRLLINPDICESLEKELSSYTWAKRVVEQRATILKNLTLVELPRNLNDAAFSDEVMKQLSIENRQDIKKAKRILEKYEIKSPAASALIDIIQGDYDENGG